MRRAKMTLRGVNDCNEESLLGAILFERKGSAFPNTNLELDKGEEKC